MDLYLIRHAWAGHQGDPRWPDDAERPLSDEGRKRFDQMVRKLVKRGFTPGIVATSPLVRCRQTAEILSAAVPAEPAVVELDELRPGSDLQGLVRWTAIQSRQHQRIAWVGHAPDVGYLTADLIGRDLIGGDSMGQSGGGIHFAKGGIAAIRFEDLPIIGGGELRWLLSAEVLGC